MTTEQRMAILEAALSFISSARPDETRDELVEVAKKALAEAGQELVHGHYDPAARTYCGIEVSERTPPPFRLVNGWRHDIIREVTCPDCHEGILSHGDV